MVDKRRQKIAAPPPTQNPDNFVHAAGRDAELQTPAPLPQEKAQDKGKKYPHRVSFDMERTQYRQLKKAAFESDRPMNEILREAVDQWLSNSGNT